MPSAYVAAQRVSHALGDASLELAAMLKDIAAGAGGAAAAGSSSADLAGVHAHL